jgi:hypothetical protein
MMGGSRRWRRIPITAWCHRVAPSPTRKTQVGIWFPTPQTFFGAHQGVAVLDNM